MSKGSDALEELKFQVGNITYFTRDLQITTFQVRDSGLFEIIGKELAALEIIKENDVDIVALKISKDLKQYNCKEDGRCPLVQEEYDLLRETLL